ncbi:MAG: hypothetical protein AAF170_08535 [Bacteroidota bacterium]
MTGHEQSERTEVRWLLLEALYEARMGPLSENVLAGEIAEAGYDVARGDIQRDLQHLERRGLIEADRTPPSGWRANISALGVDVVEYAAAPPTGVYRPEGTMTVQTRQTREARWRILQTLAIGMPMPTSERTVHAAVSDVELPVTEAAIRREMCYLQALGLVTVFDDRPVWRAELTADGVDIHEFQVDAPPGIDRPPPYH